MQRLVWLAKTAVPCTVLLSLLVFPPAIAKGQTLRSVEIEGRRCVEQRSDSGQIETWCFTPDGQLRRARVPPKPVFVEQPTVVHYTPPPPAQASLNPEAAKALSSAALKYSWSGPLKWSAISSGTLALIALTTPDLSPAAGPLLVSAGISLGVALALDASARSDTKRASLIR